MMTIDEQQSLTTGHVIQIDPTKHTGQYPACFAVITEPRGWGAIAYVTVPRSVGKPDRIPLQLQWKEMSMVGVRRHNVPLTQVAGAANS